MASPRGSRFPTSRTSTRRPQRKDFIRGYVMNATGGQTEYPQFAASVPGYGSEWKKEVKSRYVAQARVWIAGGEMLAQKENFVELDPEVKDHWGIPVLKIHFTHCDNDRKLIDDFQEKAEELFRKAGGEVMPGMGRGGPAGFPGGPGSPDAGDRGCRPEAEPRGRDTLGGSIHEVGTARMSVEPEGWRAEFVLPDARHSESVCLRRQCVSVDRRQASDADDDGAERRAAAIT